MAAWGDHVFVTWNLDKADKWKGGGADSRILELSARVLHLAVSEIKRKTKAD